MHSTVSDCASLNNDRLLGSHVGDNDWVGTRGGRKSGNRFTAGHDSRKIISHHAQSRTQFFFNSRSRTHDVFEWGRYKVIFRLFLGVWLTLKTGNPKAR
jgi:hypothetical protein